MADVITVIFPPGHQKYVGFLYLYTAYNNAVIHVFIHLLKNAAADKATKSADISPEAAGDEDKRSYNSDIELVQVEQKHSDELRQSRKPMTHAVM